MKDRTLVVVKPDAFSRGLVGDIISRFEHRGFSIVDLKMVRMSRAQAERFYSVHKEKKFFKELVSFITSGPVVAVILEGKDACNVVRKMIGPTSSTEAPSGTIRGDFGLGLTDNVIHASDSPESCLEESKILFGYSA